PAPRCACGCRCGCRTRSPGCASEAPAPFAGPGVSRPGPALLPRLPPVVRDRRAALRGRAIILNSFACIHFLPVGALFMAVERTLSIIKPDAVAQNAIGEILSRFEK